MEDIDKIDRIKSMPRTNMGIINLENGPRDEEEIIYRMLLIGLQYLACRTYTKKRMVKNEQIRFF